jgi:hypothetical protein
MKKSMNLDAFEERLRTQPLRPVPQIWRNEILAAARAAVPAGSSATSAEDDWSAFKHWMKWGWRGGLAAVWMLILFFKLSAPPTGQIATLGPSPTPREVLLALRRQAEEAAAFSPSAAERDRRPDSTRG